MSRTETLNRRSWSRRDAATRYHSDGWSDPGERAAVGHIAGEMAGKRILDIGVGGGRTVPLLTAISDDYTAIDFTPELAAVCKKRHPGRRVELMDARDMAALADASFDLAVFSYNGIDAASFADRARILAEVHRVLRPGGIFLFATHNRSAIGTGEKPWSWYRLTFNPLRFAVRTALLGGDLLRYLPNYLRNRRHNRHFDGYSTLVAATHHFSMVVLYIDLDLQRRLLGQAGFEVEAIYGSESGERVVDGTDTGKIWWFHLVARKRG